MRKCQYQNVTFDPITKIPSLGPVCNKDFKGQVFCYQHKHNAYLMAQQWLAAYNCTHDSATTLTPPTNQDQMIVVKKNGRSVTFTIDFD